LSDNFSTKHEFAEELDKHDVLSKFRDEFIFPEGKDGSCIYFNGNSLGLQPKSLKSYINIELEKWAKFGGEAHFKSSHPWVSYNEYVTDSFCKLTGAKSIEVVAMNTLTANLHFLLVSFYTPTKSRYKILTGFNPFPSDIYALKSQVRFHGYNPADAIIELEAVDEIVSFDEIKHKIERYGDQIALILIGGVNYYTGQVYDMAEITKLGHEKGCKVGFDLAHAVGNVELNLHDWNVDFAVWCNYKYINSGPGNIGGAFVHEKYMMDLDLHRFAGWWGHNKEKRFLMEPDFDPIPGAEGWQVSNPSILGLAALRSSLEIFDQADFILLLNKSRKMWDYMKYLINELLNDKVKILTPANQHGCQLSLVFPNKGREIYNSLTNKGVYCDWREPNVIRIAPVPLYNSFMDCYNFVNIIKQLINE